MDFFMGVVAIFSAVYVFWRMFKLLKEKRREAESRKLADPLYRAQKDWQLAKVPHFVKFLDEALAVKKGEPGRLMAAWRSWRRKQKRKWRIEYGSDQPLLPRSDSAENLDDKDDKVQKIEDWYCKMPEIFEGPTVTTLAAQLKEAPSLEVEPKKQEEGNCCFPFFGKTLARIKNAASRRFKHPLLGPFKALLKAEIDIANGAAKDFFDNSQKENRILLRETCSEGLDPLAREWTNLRLRADTPNLSSSGKALKHVEKLCKESLDVMDREIKDSWTLRVGAYWFLLFQVIRQSGLPLDKSFGLFSKAANESCEWKLPELVEARSSAHEILAESRTWPLVRQVSRAFLHPSTLRPIFGQNADLLLPLGWSTDKISNKEWIDKIFKESLTSESPYALRLDPPPAEISSIEEISDLLWQRNFASFHDECRAHLGELVQARTSEELSKDVNEKILAVENYRSRRKPSKIL